MVPSYKGAEYLMPSPSLHRQILTLMLSPYLCVFYSDDKFHVA